MIRCLRCLTLLLVLFPTFFHSAAQVNLNQYFDQSSIPFLNRYVPQTINYKWKVDARSQILLNEGLTSMDKGDPLLALGSFEAFLNTNYKDWAGHFYRGQALMRLGRFGEAVSEFESVIRLNADVAEAYVELGTSWEGQKNFVNAYRQFSQAAFVSPKYVYAIYKMACMDLLLNDPEEAAKLFKKCIKLNPVFADAHMALGIMAIKRRNNYQEGIAAFNAAIKADSTFAPAYFWRGLSYIQFDASQKDKCLDDWNHFVKFNPTNGFVKILRGFLKAEMGDFDGAFADFRKVLAATTIDQDRFQGTQTIFDKRTDLQFAANYLIKHGYGMKEEVFSNLKAGFCLLLMGRADKAMEYLKKADRMSTSADLYLLMAITFEHGRAKGQAFEYYGKALNMDNNIFDAHKKRSIYLSDVGAWDEAYKEIDEMFRIQPGSSVAYKMRGLMKSSQGKCSEAIKDFTVFIQSDSSDVDVLRQRARCNSLLKRPGAVTPDIMRLVKLIPPREDAYIGLLNEYIALKDTVNIMFLLQHYPTAFQNPLPPAELANILVIKGMYDEALPNIDAARLLIKEKQQRMLADPGYLARIDAAVSGLEGQIFFHQKRYADAVKPLGKGIDSDPKT